MKKLSKVLALVLAMTMVFAMFAFVACEPKTPDPKPGPGDDPKPAEKTVIKNVTIWVSESNGVADLTRQQIKDFNAQNEYFTFDEETLKVEGVSESESATQMCTDVETGADLFCFSQDQLARLVQAGALAKPSSTAAQTIKENNDASAIVAATSGDSIVAYPITSDNGYFMIYDKRVITDESHLDSLEALIADCEAAGKNFSMELDTSAWYIASFFFSTGCHSNFKYTADGKKVESVSDDWNSDKGLIAMKGIQKLEHSKNYISSSGADQFSASTPCAILVSGTWAVADVEKAIGAENVGYTDLPSFEVDGKSYHMGSFSGNKLMGVKPQSDKDRSAAFQQLALYLSGEKCQLERFNLVGWGPSNLKAQQDEKVKSNAALAALAKQSAYATPQGQIPGEWWDIAKVLGTVAKEAALNDEAALRKGLQDYETAITAIANKSDDEARRWSIIGSVGDSGWNKDLEMVEEPENTWISKDALTLDETSEWAFRMGGSWDYKVAYNDAEAKVDVRWGGPDIQNLSLAKLGAQPGTYKLKLVLTFDGDQAVSATVELIPA